jgi:hypothetical protein
MKANITSLQQTKNPARSGINYVRRDKLVFLLFHRKRTPFKLFKGLLDQDFQGTDLKRAFLGLVLVFQELVGFL